MQLSNIPAKLPLAFAAAGGRNDIPVDSLIPTTPGAASYTDGFPPLTRTPIVAGGIPPSGLDMNGILYELSTLIRWLNAGGGFPYDLDFAENTNVGGYPKGARIMRADGLGYWLNTADNNTVDPESVTVGQAALAGWVADTSVGVAGVVLDSTNVTLTPAQYGLPIIQFTGAPTADLNAIFPNIVGKWIVYNSCSGNYKVTCKTASGTSVDVPAGKVRVIWCDSYGIGATNTAVETASQFDNSQSPASTAFVRNELLGLGNGVYSAIFGASLGTNGYQKNPSGEIDLWGYQATGTTLAGDMMVTLPLSLNTFLSAQVCSANGNTVPTVVGLGADSTTSQLHVKFTANTTGIFFRCVGK